MSKRDTVEEEVAPEQQTLAPVVKKKRVSDKAQKRIDQQSRLLNLVLERLIKLDLIQPEAVCSIKELTAENVAFERSFKMFVQCMTGKGNSSLDADVKLKGQPVVASVKIYDYKIEHPLFRQNLLAAAAANNDQHLMRKIQYLPRHVMVLQNQSATGSVTWISPVTFAAPSQEKKVPSLHFEYLHSFKDMIDHFVPLYNVLAECGAVPAGKYNNRMDENQGMWPMAFGSAITCRIPDTPLPIHMLVRRGKVLRALRVWCRSVMASIVPVVKGGTYIDYDASRKKLDVANRALVLAHVKSASQLPFACSSLAIGSPFGGLFHRALLFARIALFGLVPRRSTSLNTAFLMIHNYIGRPQAESNQDFCKAFIKDMDAIRGVEAVLSHELPRQPMYNVPLDVWKIIGRQCVSSDARRRMQRPQLLFRDTIPIQRALAGFVPLFKRTKERLSVFFRQLQQALLHVRQIESTLEYKPLSPRG